MQPPNCVSIKPMMYWITDISWFRPWRAIAVDTNMWWNGLLSICNGTSDTTEDIMVIKFGQLTLISLLGASQLKERKSWRFFFLNIVPEPCLQIFWLTCFRISATALKTGEWGVFSNQFSNKDFVNVNSL